MRIMHYLYLNFQRLSRYTHKFSHETLNMHETHHWPVLRWRKLQRGSRGLTGRPWREERPALSIGSNTSALATTRSGIHSTKPLRVGLHPVGGLLGLTNWLNASRRTLRCPRRATSVSFLSLALPGPGGKLCAKLWLWGCAEKPGSESRRSLP